MGAARFLPRKVQRQRRRDDELRPGPHSTDVEAAARRFLLLGILPLWVVPGLGVIPGAEFLAATGGGMSLFGTPDRLAGFGGVAPVPRDSGKTSGSLRRPQRYNRRLQRVFYISALFSIRHSQDSHRFYDRKRSEGKHHIQAVLALARRRVNVLWALLRDGRTYEAVPPTAHAA